MNGRDPMKGRHSVGVQRVNTGKMRSGQAEPASNKFKTKARPEYDFRKRPIVPDAKETSRDEQRFISEAPSPFKNKMQTGAMPTPTSPKGAKPGGESVANPKGVYAGKSGSTVTAKALPPGSPVGYSKLPNQKFQIGGRMGFPPPARKAGAQNLSSVKRNRSFYGEA